jgi:hypothetical protein
MIIEADLKPCPFCGGKAELHEDEIGDCHTYTVYGIGCNTPHCFLERNYVEQNYEDKDKAIAEWNTRDGIKTVYITPKEFANAQERMDYIEEVKKEVRRDTSFNSIEDVDKSFKDMGRDANYQIPWFAMPTPIENIPNKIRVWGYCGTKDIGGRLCSGFTTFPISGGCYDWCEDYVLVTSSVDYKKPEESINVPITDAEKKVQDMLTYCMGVIARAGECNLYGDVIDIKARETYLEAIKKSGTPFEDISTQEDIEQGIIRISTQLPVAVKKMEIKYDYESGDIELL